MNQLVTIKPSKINGEISAPPSKSVMIRCLASGLLSQGETTIFNPSFCDDSLAAINIIKSLGAEVINSEIFKHEQQEKIIIRGINYFDGEPQQINCMESGLCLRLFSVIGGLFNNQLTFYSEGTLSNRPTLGLDIILRDLGANCFTKNGFPPIEIHGPIKPGTIHLDGSSGSQIVSGFLFALPLLDGDSEIFVQNQKSKQYIDLTIKILKDCNIDIVNDNYQHYFINGNQFYKANNFLIEGDWSGSSFILAAGAIAGTVKVTELLADSLQADRKILDVLSEMGSEIEIGKDYISVSRKELKAFEIDAEDSPDLFPVLVALACNCEGTSVIYGVNRLIHKESNRAETIFEEFTKLGAKIFMEKNAMLIRGNKLTGGIVDSHNDHRIAMALAIAGLASSGNIIIQNPQCISKSYPDFFKNLNYLAGK